MHTIYARIIATLLMTLSICDHVIAANFTYPKAWKLVHGLYGSEQTVLSPDSELGRAVILVQTMSNASTQWSTEQLEQKQSEYREGREKYLLKIKANALAWDGLQIKKNSDHTVYKLGFRYEKNQIVFQENSYFFVCDRQKQTNSSWHFVKTLIRHELEPQFESTLETTLNTYQCDSVSK